MDYIDKVLDKLIKYWQWALPENAKKDIKKLLITLQEEKDKEIKKLEDATGFILESNAFDIKELKDKHKKELEELRDECVGGLNYLIVQERRWLEKQDGIKMLRTKHKLEVYKKEILEIFNKYLYKNNMEYIAKNKLYDKGYEDGVKAERERNKKEIKKVIDYISLKEGWEETGDVYRKHFGFKEEYNKII